LPGYGDGSDLDREAIDAYVSMIQSGEINITNVPSTYKAEVAKRVGQTEETGGETPGFLGRLLERIL